MLEKLREFRFDPRVGVLVDKDKAWLSARPELVTTEARAKALERAQVDMREAAANGDKQLERKLRIRVLALDEFVRERPVIADLDPTPRPLPLLSIEDTDPVRPISDVVHQFVVRSSEPSVAAARSDFDGSNEEAPVHRRSDLGLPPIDDLSVRDVPVVDDAPTLPTPSSWLSPAEPEAPPIHRRSDLFDALDAPAPAVDAAQEGPTTGGRHRTPITVPKPLTPETTQEVTPADLVDEGDAIELDTQDRFDLHFRLMVQERPIHTAMREAIASVERLQFRADDGSLEAKAILAAVAQRLGSFRADEKNAQPEAVFRQFRTLLEDEQQPERTANRHFADRLALAQLHHRAERQQAKLAADVAKDLVTELKAAPQGTQDLCRAEAALLMGTRDRAFDEYPYSDKAFLAAELARSYETDREYATVCALMLDAQKRVDTGFLLYEIEQDAVAYKAAQDRATSLLELPADATDDDLMQDLALARLDYAQARDPAHAQEALARARELALVYDVLPLRRSLEVVTRPPPGRAVPASQYE